MRWIGLALARAALVGLLAYVAAERVAAGAVVAGAAFALAAVLFMLFSGNNPEFAYRKLSGAFAYAALGLFGVSASGVVRADWGADQNAGWLQLLYRLDEASPLVITLAVLGSLAFAVIDTTLARPARDRRADTPAGGVAHAIQEVVVSRDGDGTYRARGQASVVNRSGAAVHLTGARLRRGYLGRGVGSGLYTPRGQTDLPVAGGVLAVAPDGEAVAVVLRFALADRPREALLALGWRWPVALYDAVRGKAVLTLRAQEPAARGRQIVELRHRQPAVTR